MGERVVTLPPAVSGAAALEFARAARTAGATLLEIRSDLHDERAFDVHALAQVIPLLASLRTETIPRAWVAESTWIDVPLEQPIPEGLDGARILRSLHANSPMTTADALGAWKSIALSAEHGIKHVEPLGAPGDAARLLETQRALSLAFGGDRVTVLATGELALPFRAVLAENNAFDYLALEAQWAAAPGQRLLADAVRALRRAPGSENSRLGIFGSRIAHSRSPRIHTQPFDRIELPEHAPIGDLLDALRPWYRGFAITAPFKRALAQHVGAPLPAINTLVRTRDGWEGFNTDVVGAAAALERLRADEITALGDGGVTDALRVAARERKVRMQILRRADATEAHVTSPAVWTWPAHVPAPEGLRFDGQPVAIVAYAGAARTIAHEVVRRGGVPLFVGSRWFVAQARAQRDLWSKAA